MDLKLKVLEGKNVGQEIPVHGKKFFIGRAEDCNLRPGSELISRHHCVLLVEDGYIGYATSAARMVPTSIKSASSASES